MKICRIALDVANNNSAIATAMYEVAADGSRRRIPKTARLWNDTAAKQVNSCLVPSLILYLEKNRGVIEKDCYGHDALTAMKKSEAALNVCGNIKYRFFVDDEPYGENADDFRALTAHLLDCIKLEDDDKPDAYELRVSHPVICDQDNLFHLEETIGDALAGRNMQMQGIDFMDEAECAFRFALSNKNVRSKIYEALKGKQEAVALMCDIGGSTMELSLYRFKRQDRQVSYERMGMLRADDAAGRGMGSRTMDKTLHNKLNGMGLLDQEKLSQIPAELLQLKYFAPLKEDLNNRLRANKEGRLDKLVPIAVPAKLMENGRATKEQFEDWCAGYAASVCKQIKKLAEQEGTKAEEISLAILTGGGAELYPVEQAIRKLLSVHPHVLRPDDPRGVLDCPVDADNPDYVDGLCPKGEISSLACVLGNLAEDVKLEMPAEAPKPAFTPPKTQPVKPAAKENKYERRRYYCPDKGFVAFFKWCDNKYYCECNSVCTEDKCVAVCDSCTAFGLWGH